MQLTTQERGKKSIKQAKGPTLFDPYFDIVQGDRLWARLAFSSRHRPKRPRSRAQDRRRRRGRPQRLHRDDRAAGQPRGKTPVATEAINKGSAAAGAAAEKPAAPPQAGAAPNAAGGSRRGWKVSVACTGERGCPSQDP